MTLEPTRFLKALADETRLMLVLLVHQQGELCVCELTHALNTSQPKISRHLAQLRASGLLTDHRRGQWVYYNLAKEMPEWAKSILEAAALGQKENLKTPLNRLETMSDRPNAPRCA